MLSFMLSCHGMSAQGRTRVSRRRWTALRVAACLLLASIAADLLADNCDRASPRLPATESLGPVQDQDRPGTSGEPCADFCVPDCFCCSRIVAAGPALFPAAPMPLEVIDDPVAERLPHGVRPVPYHPPLARS